MACTILTEEEIQNIIEMLAGICCDCCNEDTQDITQ